MGPKLGILAAIAMTLSATSWAAETEVEVETEGTGAGAEVDVSGGGINVNISPEQRTQIKQYVVKEKVQPISVRRELSVGSSIPEDVELVTVPSDWGPSVSNYRYVYSSDRVVLVEPKSRRIVYIVE